jgi:hypothetical protein
VVDVAAHEQGIGLMLAHDASQLLQEVALLLAAVISIEILAQMPVAGVNELEHGSNSYKTTLIIVLLPDVSSILMPQSS